MAHDQVGKPGHPIDPLLGPLTDNGGLTTTHALRAGSPAIGRAGLAPCATDRDQRGVRRPQGRRCDIGAFEQISGEVRQLDRLANEAKLRD